MSVLPATPEPKGIPTREDSSWLVPKVGLAGLLVVLLVGIQLGAIPWRYRREIWQLQGLVLGGAIGYVVGRFSRSTGKPNGSSDE
jgi:hypothetical protein